MNLFISPVLPVLSQAPTVKDVSTYTITLEWTAWDPDTDAGDPPLVGYIVYVNFNTTDERSENVDNSVTSTTLRNLQANTSYEFRVAAVREGEGGTGPLTSAVYESTSLGTHEKPSLCQF